jgi:hypothetical protein
MYIISHNECNVKCFMHLYVRKSVVCRHLYVRKSVVCRHLYVHKVGGNCLPPHDYVKLVLKRCL